MGPILRLSEAVVQRCSVKKVFIQISQSSQEKQLCQSLFFNKVTGLGHQHFWWLLLGFTSNISELNEPKTGGKRFVSYNISDLTRLKLSKFSRTQDFKHTEIHKLRIKFLERFSPPQKQLTDVTKNSILDVEGDLRSASVIIHIVIAILVTEPHLKFI